MAICSGCLRGREGPGIDIDTVNGDGLLSARGRAFVKETDGSPCYLRAEAFLAARGACLCQAFPLTEPGEINPE